MRCSHDEALFRDKAAPAAVPGQPHEPRMHAHLNLIPRLLRPSSIANWRICRWSRLKVMRGPFAGMSYQAAECGSALLPKLLGTYEQEIVPIFDRIRELRPDVIIDVGAAEGYYAVGCAYSGLAPRIIAFEAEERAHELIRALQTLNGVSRDRIEIRGSCTLTVLGSCLDRDRCVVIMDVEGYEALLLDPLRLPRLRQATILVETHDFILPGITKEIAERMRPTHDVETIRAMERKVCDLSCDDRIFRLLPRRYQLGALSEYRPAGMKWLWLTPKIR